MVDHMNTLLTITQARALARIHAADTDAGLARKRELLARAVKWYARKVAGQTPRPAPEQKK